MTQQLPRHFLLLVALYPSIGAAQSVRPIAVKPAEATLKAEFSELTSIRELRDGRTLLTDWRENKILVADWKAGTVVPLSRIGDGPGEYRGTVPFTPLAGDSTLMADTFRRRWLLFDGARVVGTVPPDSPIVRNAELVWGVDRGGGVLTVSPGPPGRTAAAHDSTLVVRVAWRTGVSEKVVSLSQPPRIEGAPLIAGVYELAAMSLDGWIAVLRLDPYRVDWRSPDGRWSSGAAIPGAATKFDARQQQAYFAYRAADAAKSGGGPNLLGKATGPARPDPAITSWPATVPAFGVSQRDRPIFTGDGKVAIRRIRTADFPGPLYDVVDRRGTLTSRITFPVNQFILGFGASSVYVVTSDDDGIQHLSRHPWP